MGQAVAPKALRAVLLGDDLRMISGIEGAEQDEQVVVFHAGTRADDAGNVLTSGGRVLGVTALGSDLAVARDRAYVAVDRITWDDEQHRTDIALDAVDRLTEHGDG